MAFAFYFDADTDSCGFDSRKVPEVEITWRAIRIKCEC